MVKRISIMIDNDIDKKLRSRQARLIQSEQKSISYSRVINGILRYGLK